jgi:hypothetical protein
MLWSNRKKNEVQKDVETTYLVCLSDRIGLQAETLVSKKKKDKRQQVELSIRYLVWTLDIGLKMRTPTVTRNKVTTDKYCSNKEEPLHPLGVVNLSSVISKIIKLSLPAKIIIYTSVNKNNKEYELIVSSLGVDILFYHRNQ